MWYDMQCLAVICTILVHTVWFDNHRRPSVRAESYYCSVTTGYARERRLYINNTREFKMSTVTTAGEVNQDNTECSLRCACPPSRHPPGTSMRLRRRFQASRLPAGAIFPMPCAHAAVAAADTSSSMRVLAIVETERAGAESM